MCVCVCVCERERERERASERASERERDTEYIHEASTCSERDGSTCRKPSVMCVILPRKSCTTTNNMNKASFVNSQSRTAQPLCLRQQCESTDRPFLREAKKNAFWPSICPRPMHFKNCFLEYKSTVLNRTVYRASDELSLALSQGWAISVI
jgi:hypothetical protein